MLLILAGCAVPGQKYIRIAYEGDPGTVGKGVLGLAPFADQRDGMTNGYVGHRILMDNSQETFFVQGMDLAGTLKKATGEYFEKAGWAVVSMAPFEPTTDGVQSASGGFDRMVTGRIRQFECRARKKGGATTMVLDINLTFFVGDSSKTALKTIPVALNLERTELTFSQEKMERFVNQSVAEVLEKAFSH